MFWSVVILLNVALLIVFIHTIAVKLMWPDVTTKVQMTWDTVPDQFPAVTICNTNQFKVGASRILVRGWGQSRCGALPTAPD